MATHFVFGRAGEASGGAGVIPVMRSDGAVSQTITASGSNQQTSVTAPLVGQTPTCFIISDVAVYVALGANPDATVTTSRFFFPAGVGYGIACKAGDKAAVVTA